VVRRVSPAAAVTLHPCGRPGRFEATGEIGPAAWGQVWTLTTARSPAVGVQAITDDAATARPISFLELAIVIVRHRQHASRLVEDLLDIARIRSGKLHLERTAVS